MFPLFISFLISFKIKYRYVYVTQIKRKRFDKRIKK